MAPTPNDNIQSQMKKGILEYCILSIIRRGEAYPSDIVGELREAGMPVFEGTLYPLLTRLKNAGYLEYRWVESSNGPPRKYFTLSEEGQAFFQQLKTTWEEMAASVQKITNQPL
jgi:PadR family transcriptional regulator PadR